MTLKARITEDMKAAMRAHESARLSTIRLLLAAIKQNEVDERIELTDADIVAIIDKMIKQRRDSIAQFDAGGRPELSAAEGAEIECAPGLHAPAAGGGRDRGPDRDGHRRCRRTGPAAMGKVMALLSRQLAGRADMTQVSAKVKARLAGARRVARRSRILAYNGPMGRATAFARGFG